MMDFVVRFPNLTRDCTLVYFNLQWYLLYYMIGSLMAILFNFNPLSDILVNQLQIATRLTSSTFFVALDLCFLQSQSQAVAFCGITS